MAVPAGAVPSTRLASLSVAAAAGANHDVQTSTPDEVCVAPRRSCCPMFAMAGSISSCLATPCASRRHGVSRLRRRTRNLCSDATPRYPAKVTAFEETILTIREGPWRLTRWRSGDELATFLFKHIPYESIAIYFLGDHDDANGGERFFL